MSQTDAYSGMIGLFAEAGRDKAQAGALQLFLGTVTQVSPLIVSIAGTTQRAEDGRIWCNTAMTETRQISAAASLSGGSGTMKLGDDPQTVSEVQISGTLVSSLSPAALAVGDTLVLLTQDQQIFYILCKEARL